MVLSSRVYTQRQVTATVTVLWGQQTCCHMDGCEPSGPEHHPKLHCDTQTTLKGTGDGRNGPEASAHTHTVTVAQSHSATGVYCFADSGRKSPRPGTLRQGCALWPPWQGVSPEANTPSMTEPRTRIRALARAEPAGLRGSRADPEAPTEPLG